MEHPELRLSLYGPVSTAEVSAGLLIQSAHSSLLLETHHVLQTWMGPPVFLG